MAEQYNGSAETGSKVTIDVITEDQVLTWEEAAQVQTKRVFFPKFGKYVIYRDRIPLDVMAEISARYQGNTQAATLGRLVAILEYVLISPAIKSPEAKRAVVKADSALLFEIIGDVTPRNEQQAYRDSLAGEAQPS